MIPYLLDELSLIAAIITSLLPTSSGVGFHEKVVHLLTQGNLKKKRIKKKLASYYKYGSVLHMIVYHSKQGHHIN
jgi:hypothetical protein